MGTFVEAELGFMARAFGVQRRLRSLLCERHRSLICLARILR
jgi:hypothetical protein